MLEVKDLHKSFEHTVVLDGVSLSVEKGDVVAILGPSGGGKTTFLRCINFLERADSGTFTFDQETHDLAHIRNSEISRIRKKTPKYVQPSRTADSSSAPSRFSKYCRKI